MALFTSSQSPAVVVKEIDATGGVPNVQTSTGAYVGNFRWGPAETPTLVSGEAGLVKQHFAPIEKNGMELDFTSCVQFLQYSNALKVVRMVDSDAKNAIARLGKNSTDPATPIKPIGHDSATFGVDQVQVLNDLNFDSAEAGLKTNAHTFISKFPGSIGNSLSVHVQLDNADFSNWAYADNFAGRPGTSPYVKNRGGQSDEVHVAIIDSGGQFTGTAGSVLEVFPFLSLAKDGRSSDGTSTFMPTVINRSSEYIKMLNFFSGFEFDSNGGVIKGSRVGTFDVLTNPPTGESAGGTNLFFYDSAIDGAGFITKGKGRIVVGLNNGADAGVLSRGVVEKGFQLMSDKEQHEVDFLIAPSALNRDSQASLVNGLVTIAENTRKDCVVVASPARNDVVGLGSSTLITNNIVATADKYTKSSYLFIDGNFLTAYDKFNDKFVQIPGAAATAGLMAATDLNQAPWFSPAGGRRGRYFNISGIKYNPSLSERDQLYRAQVNPIANIIGQGIILNGDKTALGRVSAFDRINVRRLFLVLERAIAEAAKNVLFEFNDEFTRTEFVNIVEPVLRDVKGRRGITDFRIIADETVNTPTVVDRNEFIANIFIKPARSINFVTLNFVAVRSGVEFNEIVGTVGV